MSRLSTDSGFRDPQVTHCAQVEEYTTRHMLEAMVQDVDEHIDWLETQQALIRQLGLEQYLSEQIKQEAS